MVIAISSIVVPSVIGVSKNLNPDETLHMTPDEASWLGKAIFTFFSLKKFILNQLNTYSKYIVHRSTDWKYIIWFYSRNDG